MDFSKVIKKRHCVRKFDSTKDITAKQIKQILEAARLAPSEGNLQPWIFIIIKKQEIKQKLSEAALGQTVLEEASIVVITCIDLDIASGRYGARGKNLYSIQSTALATYNLWLLAVDLGLAACWIGVFDENKVKEILSLDDNLRPVVIMPVGFSAEKPFITDRKSIDEISKYR
jgi:nitroreductase